MTDKAETPEPSVTTPVAPPTTVPTSPTPTLAPGPVNGLAIAALVVGIVAFVSGWIPVWGVLVGAAAVVLGILGLKKATGKGLAIAGIVTGGLGLLWGVLVTALFVFSLAAGIAETNNYQEAIQQQDAETKALNESKKEFSKGETARFADKLEVKVNSVATNFTPETSRTPVAGKQYILVNVTVKNITDDSDYVSTHDFDVISKGIAVNNSYIIPTDSFTNGTLDAGDSVTGNIVYEVPAGETSFKLRYQTTVYDSARKSERLTYTLAF